MLVSDNSKVKFNWKSNQMICSFDSIYLDSIWWPNLSQCKLLYWHNTQNAMNISSQTPTEVANFKRKVPHTGDVVVPSILLFEWSHAIISVTSVLFLLDLVWESEQNLGQTKRYSPQMPPGSFVLSPICRRFPRFCDDFEAGLIWQPFE